MLRKSHLLLLVIALLAFATGYGVAKGPRLLTSLFINSGSSSEQWLALKSVQAFDDFQASIGDVRNMVLATAESEQEAIQGMRWIMRVVAEVTEISLDNSTTHPRFARMDNDVRKVGGDNPDGEYYIAPLDGELRYKISGNRGGVRYFSLNVNAGHGMTDRRLAAFLNDQTIEYDAQGNFTLLLSGERPSEQGQWVEIPQDASTIMLRVYLADRDKEVPMDIDIEVLENNSAPASTSDQALADSFTNMNYAYVFLSTLHKIVLAESWDNPNVFYTTDSDTLGGTISGPDNLYMLGSYRVSDNEALIVEVEPPQTRYWNIALSTIWWESSDYQSRQSSLTLENAVIDPDGKARFVISQHNPGVDNWLDPMDTERGMITLRWLDARDIDVPLPYTQLVPLAQLQQTLDALREPGIETTSAKLKH